MPIRPRLLLAAAIALSLRCEASAQVAVPREPVYSLDARAIVGANRIIGRTRFTRHGSSSMVRELAHAAAHGNAALAARYDRYFHASLVDFLREAPDAGLSRNDVGDARACFIQVAFKVYDGQGFDDARGSFKGPGLWGEGAIAGMARGSSSLARLEFVERIKFLTGANRRFAALSDPSKQRIYDFYAIGAELLARGYQAALRSANGLELAFLRKQARKQLKADLGVDPGRVHFTSSGIAVD